MAHALNREEFNEIFDLGLSEIRQACVPTYWSLHDPTICTNWRRHVITEAAARFAASPGMTGGRATVQRARSRRTARVRRVR